MKAADLLWMAWRALSRRLTRTALTALGIAVAVASMVIFLSLGQGIRQVLTQQVLASGPQIQITLGGFSQGLPTTPDFPMSLARRIEAAKRRYGLHAVIPVLLAVRGGLNPSQTFLIFGYPVTSGLAAVAPGLHLAKGRLLGPSDRGAMVALVGAKAAQNAGAELGSTLRLNAQSQFKVVGILKASGGLEDNFIFVPLHGLQRAENAQHRASYLAVSLQHPRRAAAVARAISKRYRVDAQTQAQFLHYLDHAIAISDALRFGISLIALIVGGLAVANTVMMGVFERIREFGAMRAIGADPGLLRRLVLVESLLLSLVGGVLGIGLGALGVLGVNAYTEHLAGIAAAAVTWPLVALAILVSLALGLLSGIFPARSAGRASIAAALGRN
jgi:putative ABC transport system permease protein